MNTPIHEGVNTFETGDASHSLTGHDPEDLNSASSSPYFPVTSLELLSN